MLEAVSFHSGASAELCAFCGGASIIALCIVGLLVFVSFTGSSYILLRFFSPESVAFVLITAKLTLYANATASVRSWLEDMRKLG